MNINIETKFNIGDIVYLSESYEGWHYMKKHPYKVIAVNVFTRLNDKPIIEYVIKNEETGRSITSREWGLFLSVEQGQVWCNEHNVGIESW